MHIFGDVGAAEEEGFHSFAGSLFEIDFVMGFARMKVLEEAAVSDAAKSASRLTASH